MDDPKSCNGPPSSTRRRGPWPADLVDVAAASRSDGGQGLHQVLEEAGYSTPPSMTIIIKRTRARDPQVDDVLDALRALCA
jgi:hypothetical protein